MHPGKPCDKDYKLALPADATHHKLIKIMALFVAALPDLHPLMKVWGRAVKAAQIITVLRFTVPLITTKISTKSKLMRFFFFHWFCFPDIGTAKRRLVKIRTMKYP